MKPHVGHIRTFGCVVWVTLPKETLGKLDDLGAMGYLMGFKHEGGCRVWIPRIGVIESRYVTSHEGIVPMLPDTSRRSILAEIDAQPPSHASDRPHTHAGQHREYQ